MSPLSHRIVVIPNTQHLGFLITLLCISILKTGCYKAKGNQENDTDTDRTSPIATHSNSSVDSDNQTESRTEKASESSFETDTETDRGTDTQDDSPAGGCHGAKDAIFKIYFDVHRTSGEFYRLPFPNNIRRTSSGIDLTGHLNPDPMSLGADNPMTPYLQMVENDLDGFGTQSAIYFRLSSPPDENSVIANRDSKEQSVLLINLDHASEQYGEHDDYAVETRKEAGNYICDNWIAVTPGDGRPLLPNTTYAVILTTAIHSEEGIPVQADEALPYMLTDETPRDTLLLSAWNVYAPLRALLADSEKLNDINSTLTTPIDIRTIAGATVFTTGTPTGRIPKIREAVRSNSPPIIDNLEQVTSESAYSVYVGTISVPFYQNGTRPFLTPEDGGSIVYDSDGNPRLFEMENVNCAVSVPTNTLPDNGWPVIIYAHGTDGDEQSFVRSEFAQRMGEQGVAVFSMEQVQHGDRRAPPGEGVIDNERPPEELFYNYLNPRAARDNNLQSAAELFAAVYAIETFESTPPSSSISFDANRVYFYGHSQGTHGSFLGAVLEPEIKGFILSGAGGLLIETLLNRHEPFDIPQLMTLLFAESNVDRVHPLLNIVQAAMDPIDPVNYAAYVFLSNHTDTDLPSRSILMGVGVGDIETPEETQFALGRALELHQWSSEGVDSFDTRYIPMIPSLPHQQTYDIGGGVTAVLARYVPEDDYDGHFVMRRHPDATYQADEFIKTLVDPSINPPIFVAPR